MATTQTSPSRVKGSLTRPLPNIKINGGPSSSFRTKAAPSDPRINDAPQLQSKTEWWYLQSHLTNGISDDPRHSVIVSVFRHRPDEGPDAQDGWAVIYATIDWRTHEYKTYSKVPPGMASRAAESMTDTHSLLSKTIQELVDTGPDGAKDGAPFLPDQLFAETVKIRKPAQGWAPGPALQLDWDHGASLVGENGAYHLKVPEIELDIQVHATGPMLLHGYDGVTAKADEVSMFYYSWPRTEVVGEYRGDRVVGTAWYDHEYSLDGLGVENSTGKTPSGWRWFSLLTVGGRSMEICITQFVKNDSTPEEYLVYMDESGQRRRENKFSVTMVDDWVSAQTFQRYGTRWRLQVPNVDVDVEIEAVAADQEFKTWLRTPSFYEGAVRFSGTWGGSPIKGFGLMELVNEIGSYDKFMDTTLNNASSLVKSEIEKVIPQAVRQGHLEHMTKLPFDDNEESVVQESIVDAFYMLTNRGGKNWRPMLLGASVGVVGGKANDWRQFLVMPEMIHTASLIIDDIEDESETRRGGPCVHRVLGVPTAINAGCAMYFWGETIIRDCENLTETQRRDYYASYFQMMRIAHAGQALDIAGMTMDKLPTIEEAHAMLARIINLHRCKSGRPAALGGTVGASLGGGTPEQIEAVGTYVENLGIAFQIRDDVLDVLGKVKGKNPADDLHNHKITYPVAKLFTLDHPDRAKWFSYWEQRDVPALVEVLKSSGTMDICSKDIEDMIEKGWDRVNRLTPNSFSKILFRMFGNFLIDRHY